MCLVFVAAEFTGSGFEFLPLQCYRLIVFRFGRHIMPRIGYIAYIDEAGDDGIKKIRTETEKGASEWFVVSAVVIHAENGPRVLPWLKDIIAQTKSCQIKHLHFYKLEHAARVAACRSLVEKEVYLFSAISYKQTMEGHENLAAEKVNINKTARFYAWMSRLLLEQVTNFIGQKTFIDYNQTTKVRVEFSDRGGLDIRQFRNYFDYLRDQSATGSLYLDKYDLDWSVVDTKEMHSFANKERAGLQLADTVASAFYSGLEKTSEATPNAEYAKLLERRMARDDSRRILDCGVKIMPKWIPNRIIGPAAELVTYYTKR
ncbi:MAG: DUF3800 domain-containing protein [Beijerinckiaceae bacterium]|nr:MAG: DUF3800 domain-containing protein [Beijerinckiaceae bacterium]